MGGVPHTVPQIPKLDSLLTFFFKYVSLTLSFNLQMINLRLLVAFLGWTVTTFIAHYSVKRALVLLLPLGVEVSPST